MKRLVAIAVLTLVTFPGVVAAADPDDIVSRLDQAKSYYQEAEFGKSVALLRQVVAAIEQANGNRAAFRALGDAYFYLGLCYIALDDPDTAKDAFRNALRHDPSRRVDPEIYAPKVVDAFEEARLAVAAAPWEVALPKPWRPAARRFRLEGVLGEGSVSDRAAADHALAVTGQSAVSYGQPTVTKPELRGFLRLSDKYGVNARYQRLTGSASTYFGSSSGNFDGERGTVTRAERTHETHHDITLHALDLLFSRRLGRTLSVELGYRFQKSEQVFAEDILDSEVMTLSSPPDRRGTATTITSRGTARETVHAIMLGVSAEVQTRWDHVFLEGTAVGSLWPFTNSAGEENVIEERFVIDAAGPRSVVRFPQTGQDGTGASPTAAVDLGARYDRGRWYVKGGYHFEAWTRYGGFDDPDYYLAGRTLSLTVGARLGP